MVECLIRAVDRAWSGFGEALAGLTEAEYRWKPGPDALTLADLLPQGSEDWRAYFANMPVSGRLSTIEYKVAHVATCKIMYAEYAFGPRRLQWRWADLDVPRVMPEMLQYVERAHAQVKSYLTDLEDADLPETRNTNWGELWPTERILWTLFAHDIYHGAQIRTMRGFFRAAHKTA